MNDAERARYVELSVICDRILLMMDEAKSPYSEVMELVRDARKHVLIQPEKSVKIMRKALAVTEEEYNLVSEFDKLISAFPVNQRENSGSEAGVLESAFRDQIRKGKFRDAKKSTDGLRELSGSKNYRKYLTVNTVDNNVKDMAVNLIITNTSEKDLVIQKTEVASFDAVSATLLLPNKIIKSKSQMTVPISFDTIRDGVSLITVTIWYESDFDMFEESLSVKVFNSSEGNDS